MRALLVSRHAPIRERPLDLVEMADPEPGPAEIVVRVSACAICRTDLHVIEGDLPPQRIPIVPGHQIVGRVEGAGPQCRRFRPGDRVGIAWLRWTCGRCTYCLSGAENLCDGSRYTGYHEHGGYAEKAVVAEDYAYALPAAFSDLEAAPLLCAGIIGFRALKRSAIQDGGRLAIYGFGSSAHVVIQIARHRGCEVLVATRGAKHRELALHLGASWAGDTFDPLPAAPDGAIVFAPAGEIVPAALRAVRKGGTVALAGIHMSPIPEMEYRDCLFHEKNLVSVEANTRLDGEALLREAAEIRIRPRVTPFALDEANEALNRLASDGIDGTGVLVIPPS